GDRAIGRRELCSGWGDLRQRIRQGAVVEQLQLVDSIPRAIVEVVRIDADPIVRDPNRPEEATRRDARAHVVFLVSIGCERIHRTLIEVESYEAESSFVLLSVHPDVFAAHEPVVAVEVHGLRLSRFRIPGSAGALDGGDPGGATVVEDRARLYP